MIGKGDILFSKKSALNNVLLTDCMSVIRWKPFTRFYIFIDLFSSIQETIASSCYFQQLQVVYDSYVDSSVKVCECRKRSTCQSLEYLNLQLDSKVPMQSQVLRSNDKLEDCVRISDNITSVLPTLTSSLEEADARVVAYLIMATTMK